MIKVRQGYGSLSEPCKTLEGCVLEGTLDHGDDPVMAWAAENAEAKTDENGNIRPVKPDHKSNKRIDPIVGTIIALAVAGVTVPDGPSLYESAGADCL